VENRPEISIKAVVYATDFSVYSENAGHYARYLADQLSATLFVTHAFVLAQPAMEVEVLSPPTVSGQRKALQEKLVQRASTLDSGSQKAVPILLEGNPHEVIPALAEKHAPSLLVLGTHGAGRIEHELIGSVAEKILRSTSRPCLTVGPQAAPAPAGAHPFQRILYATDFTPGSTHAASFAFTVAEAADGAIDILNVISEGAVEHPDRSADLEGRFFHALDQLIPQQARQFCTPRTFVETGNPHDRIMEHIRERAIDLLVLGIRKTSHITLEMRTSNAYRLIADAPCPVLTIAG
jgi:nucleotide-binding universal stress UspA family protein